MSSSIIFFAAAAYLTALGLGLLIGIALGTTAMLRKFNKEAEPMIDQRANQIAEELVAIRRLTVSIHGICISMGRCVEQQHKVIGGLLKEQEAKAAEVEKKKGCLQSLN